MSRLLAKTTCVVIVIILAVGIYILRYNHLLHKLHYYDKITSPTCKVPVYPKLTTKQAVMISGGHSKNFPHKSSYIHYPYYKKPDTTRIGIFGCSHVAGSEVAGGHDFPSFLQDKFNKGGIKNIEVINFGLAARGVHQMYLLWEFIGKDYNFDYVVFYPFNMHRKDRDNSFCLPFQYNRIYARYIIKDGKLKLIPVVGATFKEALKIYYSIIPPWRYIRYDKKMPLFLRALLPSGLHNRTNPFYYRPPLSGKDEILTTYEMIFNRLSKQVDNLIIVANEDEIYSLREKIHSPNVHFMRSQVPKFTKSFLYLAPKGHLSAMGNKMRADDFFCLFMDYKKPEFNIIELSHAVDYPREDTPSLRPLCEYKDISINIGPYPLAGFVMDGSKIYWEKIGCDLNFRKYKIESLLLVPTPNINVKYINFIPLPFLLKDKEQVFLSFKINDKLVKVPIGIVDGKAVMGKLLVSSNKNKCLAKTGVNWNLKVETNGKIFLRADAKVRDVCIMVGDRRVLKMADSTILNSLKEITVSRKKTMITTWITSFHPVGILDFAYLRAKGRQFIDVDAVQEKEGTLDLVLSSEDGHKERLPIFSYKIIPAVTSAEDVNISNIFEDIEEGGVGGGVCNIKR